MLLCTPDSKPKMHQETSPHQMTLLGGTFNTVGAPCFFHNRDKNLKAAAAEIAFRSQKNCKRVMRCSFLWKNLRRRVPTATQPINQRGKCKPSFRGGECRGWNNGSSKNLLLVACSNLFHICFVSPLSAAFVRVAQTLIIGVTFRTNAFQDDTSRTGRKS